MPNSCLLFSITTVGSFFFFSYTRKNYWKCSDHRVRPIGGRRCATITHGRARPDNENLVGGGHNGAREWCEVNSNQYGVRAVVLEAALTSYYGRANFMRSNEENSGAIVAPRIANIPSARPTTEIYNNIIHPPRLNILVFPVRTLGGVKPLFRRNSRTSPRHSRLAYGSFLYYFSVNNITKTNDRRGQKYRVILLEYPNETRKNTHGNLRSN